jgi:hypothetical protein
VCSLAGAILVNLCVSSAPPPLVCNQPPCYTRSTTAYHVNGEPHRCSAAGAQATICELVCRIPPLRHYAQRWACGLIEIHACESCEEYRLTISQLSKKSLKNIRLVNKLWGQSAAALLWHTFRTDLCEFGAQSIDALFTSGLDGIFKCIKKLHVTACFDDPGIMQRDTWLLQLLILLPRNSLTEFVAHDKIDSRVIGVMLQTQTRLRLLSAPIDTRDGVRPPDRNYVAGNISNIETLTIYANDDQRGYETWFDHMPILQDLTVKGWRAGHRSTFHPWTVKNRFLKLRNLHFNRLTLANSSGRLELWIQLPYLERLAIQECQNMGDFLNNLRDSCTKHRDFNLKELVLCDSKQQNNSMRHFNELLRHSTGLESLHVSTRTGLCVDPTTLKGHMDTLHQVLVDPLNDPYDDRYDDWSEDTDFFTSKELHKLTNYCPNVTELGTTIAMIKFKHWGVLSPLDLSPDVEVDDQEECLRRALVRDTCRGNIWHPLVSLMYIPKDSVIIFF